MKLFGEIVPRATDAAKNIRNKSKKEFVQEFYVDSGRELEVDDAVIKLESHAVRAREFLAVSQVVSISASVSDDEDTEDTDQQADYTQTVDVGATQAPQQQPENPEASEAERLASAARLLIDEVHDYDANRGIVVESVLPLGEVKRSVLGADDRGQQDV